METNDEKYEIIGKGAFSKVCLVEHNGLKLARKEIKITEQLEDAIKNEISILQQLDHPNVLLMKNYEIDGNMRYIYTEYVKKGDLGKLIDEKISKNEDFTFTEIINFMEDLVSGLKYIHSKGIIHRDLKPGNILVGNHKKLIISDFGLATGIDSTDYLLNGTPNFIAPELWDEGARPYSTASDIFALGCVFYEIYTLRMAFDGENNEVIKNRIKYNEKMSFRRLSGIRFQQIEELIKQMLEKDVNKRIKIDEIEKEVIQMLNTPPIAYVSHNSTLPLPSIDNTSSEEASFSSNCDSFILNFYLGGGNIEGKTLKEIRKMNLEEFSSFWKDDYLALLFPSVDEKGSEYTKEYAVKLENRKDSFINDLYRVIDLIDHGKDNLNKILNFLKSIEDYEYVEKLNKEKKYKDNYEEGKKNLYFMNYKSSIECFTIALNNTSSKEEEYECHFRIAECYFNLKDYDKSMQFYKSAFEFNTTIIERYDCNYHIGLCFMNLKDNDKADEYFSMALESCCTKKEKYYCFIRIGFNYFINNEYEKSKIYFLNGLDLTKINFQIFISKYFLGNIYFKKMEYERSINYYKSALESDHNSFEINEYTHEQQAEVNMIMSLENYYCFYSLGMCYFINNNYQESIHYFLSALENASKNEEKYICNTIIGECYWNIEQYENSIKYYKSALENAFEIEKKSVSIVYLGKCFITNETEKPIEYYKDVFEKANSTDKDIYICSFGINGGCMDSNELEDSIEYNKSVLGNTLIDQEKYTCYINIGNSYWNLKHYQQAIENYNYAFQCASTNGEKFTCNMSISDCYFNMKNDEKAMNNLILAFEFAESDEDKCLYYINMCKYMFNINPVEESNYLYNESLKLANNDHERFRCNFIIGNCFFERGKYEEFKKYLNESSKYMWNIVEDSFKIEFGEIIRI